MFRHMDIWSPREPWQSPETNVGPGFRAFKYYKVLNGLFASIRSFPCKKQARTMTARVQLLSTQVQLFAKLLQQIGPNESNLSPTWSNKSPTFDQTAAKNRSTPVQLEANLVQRKSNFLQVCCRKHGPTRVQLHCRPSHACA